MPGAFPLKCVQSLARCPSTLPALPGAAEARKLAISSRDFSFLKLRPNKTQGKLT